ncbi:MAG: hypothetical protein ACD_60C00015G0004 [uncultured bacterium]|nr:MAG: hypothetical protein ACD_60C00015G0004 [uncultured bacterium]HLB57203.1 cell division protein FtsL [Gammaproteobacteria bacterium]
MNAAARLLNQGTLLSRSWVVSIFLTREQLPFLTMIAAVLISGLSVIYMTNTTRSLNASIQQTVTERNRLHVESGQLLLERSTWTMQARIQNEAEGQLGMVIPDNKSVVVVNE